MLRTWLRWRGSNTVRKKKVPIILAASIPKTRQLQDTEVYSKLFYESKLKHIVNEETIGKSLNRTEKLAKIVEVTKWEWALESDEVKAEVKAKKEELQNERKPDLSSDLTPSPEQYQAAINDLSYVTSAF